MGRSSKAKASMNRARIVDVATDLFRQQGVTAVSIADIMTAAGMTQGGFYKHFESKDALAVEAYTAAFARAATGWKDKAAKADLGSATLQDLIASYLAPKPPERTCPMIAYCHDAASRASDDPLRIAYGEGVRHLFQAFSEVARRAYGSSFTEAQVSTLFAAMVGSTMLARGANNEAWIDQMQRLVLNTTEIHTEP
jgi:TetR/AcrR family transcriptional regulator, transcriptional repressor for nem operon